MAPALRTDTPLPRVAGLWVLGENQISQVPITKNTGAPLPRRKSFSSASALTLNIIASVLESLGTAKRDPEEFCWSGRDQLMEKGWMFPLPHCPGRSALIPVRLSESHLSKFILVSIFIVPPQINTMQKH